MQADEPDRGEHDPVDPLVDHRAVAAGVLLHPHARAVPRRNCVAIASACAGSVRSDGNARTTSFSSCCWSTSDCWPASSGRSAVASCAMLNDGSIVRNVPSSVSSARDSTVIAPGTSSPCRCMTSSIMAHRLRVEAAGSEALAQHQADVGLEGAAVAAPRRHRRGGWWPRAEDDRVVQLEADRHLLQRLEHHRTQPADGAEVEEPEAPRTVDEDVPWVRVGVVHAVAQHLVEERVQEATGQHVRPVRELRRWRRGRRR